MLTKIQLANMLALQDAMNKKVNPNWLEAGYAYLRAAMIESVEAIEHHGWKWWKAQHLDLPQVQMELVDIWHFALSHILIEYKGDAEQAATHINAQLSRPIQSIQFDTVTFSPAQASLVENLELMAGMCVVKRFDVPLFMHIVEQAEMQADDLYQQYVGKNVLNFFRQDNGYKSGEYIKIWQGKEDNEHLVEVLNELDAQRTDYADALYDALKQRYPN